VNERPDNDACSRKTKQYRSDAITQLPDYPILYCVVPGAGIVPARPRREAPKAARLSIALGTN
jgi:hypothetical protein